MYQKKSKGWYKHKDFIFIDLVCISLAFLLADWIRNGTVLNLYENEVYRNTAIFLLKSGILSGAQSARWTIRRWKVPSPRGIRAGT